MIGLRPVHPGEGIVLAIGVVVAVLRLAHFRAGAQHGGAARQEQRGQEITLVALPRRQDAGVVGRSFHPMVPGPVLVPAVAVVLAVIVVVLAVVADEIGQGEAVVGRDEIDRAGRMPLRPEEVRRARDARAAGVARPVQNRRTSSR